MSLEIRVYVGTYGKYNGGSIAGEWLDLEDYSSQEEFYNACRDLHKDEEDPEFMFQDFDSEYFRVLYDYDFIGECHINEDLFEFIEKVNSKDLDLEQLEAFLNVFGHCDLLEAVEKCEEMYFGYAKNDTDFGYYMEEIGCLEIPEHIQRYFDYEAYGRDCGYDFSEYNGFYFDLR